ncbi:MAG: heme ABC transporter permease [Gammaproteobacteria bacterium]|nr:heme ABC transporter permease [Gammaproteobacteria bacterium]
MWSFFYKLASPKWFYELAGKLLPWFAIGAAMSFALGGIWGLAFSPPDYQQGDSVRIMYIHVPAAILSLSVYTFMAITAIIGLVWKIKLAHMVSANAAPIGAAFTAIALATGSLWGRPMWGTWWEWDARLTSELILLFLYFGVMALRNAIDERTTADKAAGLLAVVGVVNVPIIHYSVEWWNTLHQGSSITSLARIAKPAIHADMLWPLLLMILAFKLFFVTVLLMRTRNEVLDRERRSAWVGELLETRDGV